MYSITKPLLFLLPEEISHEVTLDSLSALYHLKLLWLIKAKVENIPKTVMGIKFRNPLGLAAGLDKNGDYIDALAELGFGFIEIGTLTPKPQMGNPHPRLFRVPQYQALINRMGFNNKGIDHAIANVKHRKSDIILGINIGKNATTPIDRAKDDYLHCFNKAYVHADYITVNISSPNTENLRSLQHGDELRSLLSVLKKSQTELSKKYKKYVPIAVKIAPDMNESELEHLCRTLVEFELDAVIISNTTLSRPNKRLARFTEAGGLSGSPLTKAANDTLKFAHDYIDKRIPIIGVGGIMNARDAGKKIELGADLVQIYTGLIYHGPQLISDALDGIYAAKYNQPPHP